MRTGRKPARPARPERAVPSGRRGGSDTESRGGGRQRASERATRRSAPAARRPQEPRGLGRGPRGAPASRPAERPVRPKTTDQAKARAKARKAKAPKVVRPPLRERLQQRIVTRLAGMDLRPQALLARVPFVVLVIGALGVGLGITLWLSTDAAQRSYQLRSARALNDALGQQKEALERDVLQADSAPALAEAARDLGMIPSRDTAHLVQDPGGNWVVVGKPKPAEGGPPPPLNTKLPDLKPPAPPSPAPKAAPPAGAEVPTRIVPPGAVGGVEVPVRVPSPSGSPHAAGQSTLPGPVAAPGGLVLVPVDPAAPGAAQ